MNPEEAYKHCLLCGSSFETVEPLVLRCTACHFKHYLNASPCNAVIIENNLNQILLVKRARDPHKGKWDLPGGFINAGEEYADSVKREVKEELGCEVEIERIIGVYTDTYLYQNIIMPTFCVIAKVRLITSELKIADDVSDYQFFSKGEIFSQDIAFKTIIQALHDYLD